MPGKQYHKRIFWSIFRKMFLTALAILVLTVTAGFIFFYDMIYTTLLPPVSSYEKTPIDITRANSVTSILIKIRYNRVYDHFRFSLVFTLPENIDRNSLAYREKRGKLAQFVGQTDYSPGVKFPVRLTIKKMKGGSQILYHDKIYMTKDCRAWRSNSFIRQIAVLFIPPGSYQVRLENLKEVLNVPDEIKVALEVGQFGSK